MELVDIITEDMCSVSLSAKRKDDVLIEIAQFIKKSPVLENLSTEKLITALRERESLGSTGFGDGIAIPHCKLDEIDDFAAAIMISKKGVDFDSIDGKIASGCTFKDSAACSTDNCSGFNSCDRTVSVYFISQ